MIDNRTLLSYGLTCCFIMASLSLISSAIAENTSPQLMMRDSKHCYQVISQKIAGWVNIKFLTNANDKNSSADFPSKLGIKEASQQAAVLLQKQASTATLIDSKIKTSLNYTQGETA